MEIRNRLFPYPVLCLENDDYVDSTFDVRCDVKEELANLVLDFECILDGNEELNWLIREGLAEFVIHIECTYTAFRTIIKTSGKNITYRIPKSRVNVEINLVGAIVASKKICAFRCKHLNEDYRDEDISFERGAILAYSNMPRVFVTKNYEELAGDNKYFTIIRRVKTEQNEQNPVSYDIDGAKIKILVDEEIFDEYARYRNNANMESLTGTLLVMPAIIYMIEILRNEGTEKYKAYYWYQKISNACKLQSVDFEADLIFSDSKTAVEIAQDLLKLPINRAFEGIARVVEE